MQHLSAFILVLSSSAGYLLDLLVLFCLLWRMTCISCYSPFPFGPVLVNHLRCGCHSTQGPDHTATVWLITCHEAYKQVLKDSNMIHRCGKCSQAKGNVEVILLVCVAQVVGLVERKAHGTVK